MRAYFYRKYTAAFCFLALAVSFSACNKETLRGHGDTVSRTRTVGNFDQVTMSGNFEVYLTQGPAKDIVLEGQENVLADLKTTTRNNKLEIEFRSKRVKIDEPVRVYLTTPNLTSFSVSGSNNVHGLNDWEVNNLDLSTSGSGSIDLAVRSTGTVESHISGSGEISLYGTANKHVLDKSGSGKLKAFDFETRITEVNTSGSGQGDVWATEQLKVNISGSGTVRYKGNPSVSASVSGSGKIQKWD
jgi:hypothetical protein